MGGFKQRIRGNKHSILHGLYPLVDDLDRTFGEENVYTGYIRKISRTGHEIRVRPKYFDPRRRWYILQVKKGSGLQYFYLKLDETRVPEIEQFAKKYPR